MNKRYKITREYLLDKAVRDEMQSTSMKYSTLNSFMSGLVSVIGKLISAIALLSVAASVSGVIFAVSSGYIVAAITYNLWAQNKMQEKYEIYDRALSRARYYQAMPKNPGLAKEVRIYESRKDVVEQWSKAYETIERFDKKHKLVMALHPFVSGIIFYAAMALLVLISVFAVARGEMKPDVFLMVLFAVIQPARCAG